MRSPCRTVKRASIPLSPMSHGRTARAHASTNLVRDYVTVPPITQEELDGLQISFRDHAQYVLNHGVLTLAGYRAAYSNFRHFLRDPENAGRPLSELLVDLDAWVAWNRKRGCSAITTNTYFRTLRPFFHYLEKKHGFPKRLVRRTRHIAPPHAIPSRHTW